MDPDFETREMHLGGLCAWFPFPLKAIQVAFFDSTFAGSQGSKRGLPPRGIPPKQQVVTTGVSEHEPAKRSKVGLL